MAATNRPSRIKQSALEGQQFVQLKTVKAQRHGGSLQTTIPKHACTNLGIEPGDDVEVFLDVERQAIIARPKTDE